VTRSLLSPNAGYRFRSITADCVVLVFFAPAEYANRKDEAMRHVAILLFDDVEVLDFAGPFEIFSVTGCRHDAEPPFNVYTVAEKEGVVLARNKLRINPHYTIDHCPPPDILVVPGGYGTHREMHNPAVLDGVRQQAARVELLSSVCTGALVLAKAGLLEGLSATPHYSFYDRLQAIAPNTSVRRGERFVDHGTVITSAGVQAGMDMSLHMIARWLGVEVARETAHYIEYDWQLDPARAQ
jgi:transcriptional regulator GlxA family with amidase domain